MKDIQKIKEFFSKPLEEAKKETAVDMAKKQLDTLGVKYELGNEFKPFKTIYKPTGKSDKFYDTFNDIVDLFNLGNAVKSSMSEAKQEDPTDIIAMDVPLFLRMLEYAREDAEQDIDLHKVTERAIEAVKLRGLLSMEDYQDIIGESKDELDEEVGFLSLKDDNPFDDVPSIDIQMIDDKEGASSPKAFVNFSSMYHSGDNGKMEILRNNPALQDKVMQMLQAEFQKTFRRVIHGVLGEPFGLNEDAFEDTWKLNQRKAQSFIEKFPDDLNIGFVKAYLTFDDIVKANKYWNDFNLEKITSRVEYLTEMESLKELVKNTLTEKKKKETAASK